MQSKMTKRVLKEKNASRIIVVTPTGKKNLVLYWIGACLLTILLISLNQYYVVYGNEKFSLSFYNCEDNQTYYSFQSDNNTIFLYLPQDTDICELKLISDVPIVYTEGAELVSEREIKVLEKKFFLIRTSEGEDFYVNVATSSLPSICITLNNTSLSDIHSGTKDSKYKGNRIRMVYKDEEVTYENVELKGRGNFTWTLPKRSYQLKFEKKVDLFGMGKAKKWILLPNYTDNSLMRNKFAFDIAKKMNIKYAVDSEFIDLWISGNYIGSYLISEKIEIGDNRVAIDDSFSILLELDNLYYNTEEIYSSSQINNTHFVLKDSVSDDHNRENSITDAAFDEFMNTINEFEDALYNGRDWGTVSSYIDVNSFVKMYLLQELSEDSDGCRSSFFLYKDGLNDVIHLGPAWDYDIAFGNFEIEIRGGNPSVDYIGCISDYMEKSSNVFRELLKYEEFRRVLCAYYYYVFSAIINDYQSLLIDYSNQLSDSAKYNFARWNTQGKNACFPGGHHNKETYSEEVAYLSHWLSCRIDYMNEKYLSMYFSDESMYCIPYDVLSIFFQTQNSNEIWDYRVIPYIGHTKKHIEIENIVLDSDSGIEYCDETIYCLHCGIELNRTRKKYLSESSASLSEDVLTYDGTGKYPKVSVWDGDICVDDSEYSVQYINNVNAGIATVLITDNEGGEYCVHCEKSFEIIKADPKYEMPRGLNANYGDTLSNVKLSEGWSWLNSDLMVGDVGENRFTALFTPYDIENYNCIIQDLKVDVHKIQPDYKIPIATNNLVYNGGEQELVSLQPVVGGNMLFAIKEVDGTIIETPNDHDFFTSIPTAINAGTYKVWFKVNGDSNHLNVDASNIEVTINRAKVSVQPENTYKIYDNDEPELIACVLGLQGEDKAEIIRYNISRDIGENAGQYTIYTSGEKIQGNYDVDYMTGIFNIKKADLKLTLTMSGWSYGGEHTIPIVSGNVGNGDEEYSYKLIDDSENAFTTKIPEKIGDYIVRVNVAATENYNAGETRAEFTIAAINDSIPSNQAHTESNQTDIMVPMPHLETTNNVVDGIYNNVDENVEDISNNRPVNDDASDKSDLIPSPSILPTDDSVDDTEFVVTEKRNKNGSITKIIIHDNNDGTTSSIERTTNKDGSSTELETITDKKANILKTRKTVIDNKGNKETVSVFYKESKTGNKTVTIEENSDSVIVTTVKKTKNKEVITINRNTPEGTLYERIAKNAKDTKGLSREYVGVDGSKSSLVAKIYKSGKVSLTYNINYDGLDITYQFRNVTKNWMDYTETIDGSEMDSISSVTYIPLKLTKLITESTSATIPSEFKVGDIIFHITGIAKAALVGNKQLETIEFGNYLTDIYTGAFSGVEKLNTIVIASEEIKNIAKGAFKDISNDILLVLKVPKKAYRNIKKILKNSEVSKMVKIKRGL